MRHSNNWQPRAFRFGFVSIPRGFQRSCTGSTGGFTGQGGAFIGSGNWTTFELVPFSATNFKDETEMYTNDPTIVNALRYKFDLMWADTTTESEAQVTAPYILDWPDAYKNDTGKDWLTDCPCASRAGSASPRTFRTAVRTLVLLRLLRSSGDRGRTSLRR